MLVGDKSANEKNKAERRDGVWWGWGGAFREGPSEKEGWGGAWPELSQQAAFC